MTVKPVLLEGQAQPLSSDSTVPAGDRVAWILLLIGVALVSTASMAMEIVLTRVFSVLYFYHYVFAIISGAVLGIAVGASIVHFWAVPADVLRRLRRLALLAGSLVLGLAHLIAATVSMDGRLLLALASALPYVLVGMVMTTVFSTWAARSPTLYWADLGGASVGALVAIPLLNWLGGLDALLLVSLLFGAAAICFHLAGSAFALPRAEAVLGIALPLLAVIALGSGWLQVDMGRLATPKPLTRRLQEDPQARVVGTDWDAFARIDVLESQTEPWHKQVFINGAAGSLMPRAPADSEDEARLTADVGYFPFGPSYPGQDAESDQQPALQAPRGVFVIGPGGGRDVLFALLAGSERVTAVEVSPGVVRAVRQFGDYNGHLFDHPNVNLVIDEGRSALRRSESQFDLISLSEVIALTAERGSYILTESYVYTVEAFHDYLDHLAPGGRVALRLYDELTLTRAFVTAITALEERGLSVVDATRRIVVLLDPDLVSREAPFRSPVLILYRDPISPQAAEGLLSAIRQADFIPLFVPHVHERPPLSALAAGATTLDAMVAGFSRADISPTTDARPFFYEFRRGLPGLLRRLLGSLAVMAGLGVLALWRHGRAAWGPLLQQQGERPRIPRTLARAPVTFWRFTVYFSLLGAAFMMMELAVIQRLTLFLGHPTTALAVGLFAVLTSSGVGSLVAGRLVSGGFRRAAVVRTGAILGGLLACAFLGLVPPLTGRLLVLPLYARMVAAVVMVFPLFFCLGVPFPLGLQMARSHLGPSMVPLAWGSNGLASVIGSVGAVAIAILWGFDALFVSAALCYAVVALLTVSTGRP